MNYSPLKDKKFVALLADAATFLVLYFVGKYAAPSVFDDVKVVFGTIQPPIALWIAAQFQAEGEDMKRGFLPEQFWRRPQ